MLPLFCWHHQWLTVSSAWLWIQVSLQKPNIRTDLRAKNICRLSFQVGKKKKNAKMALLRYVAGGVVHVLFLGAFGGGSGDTAFISSLNTAMFYAMGKHPDAFKATLFINLFFHNPVE